ncbi:MAG: hypothetical protein WB526_10555 [Candidatus Cybelea sp.]
MAILYELGGQKVSREEFTGALDNLGMMGAIMERVINDLTTKIEEVRCAEHSANPTVTVSLSDEGPNFQVAGCCADLKAKTESVLRSIGGQELG